MIKSTAAIVGFGLLSFATAQAELESLEPKVAYSAHRSFSDGEMRMEGAYHFTPGKHRNEMQIGGQSMTAIIREDLDVLWSLASAPGQGNFYMEMSLDSKEARNGNALVGSAVTESRRIGSEKVGGYPTTKYEVTVNEPEGTTFAGTVWVTDDVIPVRMEMLDPRGRRLVLEQSDIAIGPQPDALFEVPAGYKKIGLGGLGARIGKGVPGLGGGRNADAGDDTADDGDGGNEFAREVAGQATEAAKQGVVHGVAQGVRDKVGGRIRGLFNRGD